MGSLNLIAHMAIETSHFFPSIIEIYGLDEF